MIFSSHTFEILGERGVQMLFVKGLATSIELFALSAIAAFALGALLAVLRMSAGKAAEWLVAVFVEYHRNVPSIVQILVWYFGVPQWLPEAGQAWLNEHLGGFFLAAVALALNAAAYISEDLRSGFRSLPHAQYEAARALGLSHLQTMRRVLVPQAFRAAMPALVNQSLSLFKSTSLAMAIGVSELMYMARQIDGETYATFAAYLVPTLVYLACSMGLMFGGDSLQRRLAGPPAKVR